MSVAVGERPTCADFASAFERDLLEGLSRPRKSIPCKHFYDDEGARLFERICRTPEYYPTRTEHAILDAHGPEIAAELPREAVLVEFGSGEARKIEWLLDALPEARAYVPIDIDPDGLGSAAERLARHYPGLLVRPVHADFTRVVTLPADLPRGPRVGFFPGSTIGNFDSVEAAALLQRYVATLGEGASLLLGVDLLKDPRVLHAAYNDAAGVTAAFNRNLLARANREAGADFDLDGFVHRAFFNRVESRVEMHLVSVRAQRARIGDRAFSFRSGETIHTENSYKYHPTAIRGLAAAAGLAVERCWTDPRNWFAVCLLRAAHETAAAVRPLAR